MATHFGKENDQYIVDIGRDGDLFGLLIEKRKYPTDKGSNEPIYFALKIYVHLCDREVRDYQRSSSTEAENRGCGSYSKQKYATADKVKLCS